jgi:hypothetical protein
VNFDACWQAHLSEWARLPGAKLQPLPLHSSRAHTHSVLSREEDFSLLYQTASESILTHALLSSVDNEGGQGARDDRDVVDEGVNASHIHRLE